MILYHGSNVEIEKIDLSKSMRGKDFGQGFYLSAERGQAEDLFTNYCFSHLFTLHLQSRW